MAVIDDELRREHLAVVGGATEQLSPLGRGFQVLLAVEAGRSLWLLVVRPRTRAVHHVGVRGGEYPDGERVRLLPALRMQVERL